MKKKGKKSLRKNKKRKEKKRQISRTANLELDVPNMPKLVKVGEVQACS